MSCLGVGFFFVKLDFTCDLSLKRTAVQDEKNESGSIEGTVKTKQRKNSNKKKNQQKVENFFVLQLGQVHDLQVRNLSTRRTNWAARLTIV